MVGPLTFMKILHCRNSNKKGHGSVPSTFSLTSSSSKNVALKRIKDPSIEATATPRKKTMSNNKGSYKIVKTEIDIDLCRVCLREGKFPIFGDTEDLVEGLKTIGGIDVSFDDPHPKYLCQPCNALLQGALLFRKTAKHSDELLKKKEHQGTRVGNDDNYSDFSDNELPTEITKHKTRFTKFLSCKTCDLQFSSYKEYNDHTMSSEHENKKHMCPICKNSYAPQYLKKHMTTHDQGVSYVCDVCGKNYKVQSHFTRHRLTHFYSLPFQCSLCPYKGRFSESLKMHMRSHTGEKPYQCAQCPSRFISKSNLNKHTLTHKGEHDFRCEMCGRGFYTKRELELHFKVDHTGIKEHVCKICGKAFGYRKQMMKHGLKVHKREKLRSGRMPIYLKVEKMKQENLNNVTNQTVQQDIQQTEDISSNNIK